jgi:nucleoside-diphosphate-sugar epimerase/uncharacterized Fe-S cluster-containing radical SAM superfamily protein
MRRARVAAVLGAGGRLGPSIVAALGAAGLTVRGLSRRGGDVVGARSDREKLREVLQDAEVVIDVIGADERDANALIEALPTSVAQIISIACRASRRNFANAARLDALSINVQTLVLPRLIGVRDPERRDAPYIDTARKGEPVLLSGDGSSQVELIDVEDVAALVAALVDDPARGPRVVCGTSITMRSYVTSLLEGARLPVHIARHPDARFRDPPRDLPVDLKFASVSCPRTTDVHATLRAHGAWLAEAAPSQARPRRVLPVADTQYRGRREIDVHARRDDITLERPVPALEELAGLLSPSYYVDVGRPCNSACVYCAVPPHADTEGFAPLERLEAQIAAGREAGCDRAILIGGEPTIYPRLEALLALLDREAGRNVIMTNGLRLADQAFCTSLVKRGIGTFHVSVDTNDAAVYDRLSRSSGKLEQQWRGLDHALGSGANVYVYVAVTHWNARGLTSLVDALVERAERARRAPVPIVLAFMKPLGDALLHADALWVSPSERVELASATIEHASRRGTTVGLRNLQPCLAPELMRFNLDLYLADSSIDLATNARQRYAHEVEYAEHIEACTGCGALAVCPGVYRTERGRIDVQLYRAIDVSGRTRAV